MKYRKFYFNMIEVVLALAVVGIGVTGLVGVLPVAVNSTKAAIGDSYAADAANTFASYIELMAKKDSGAWGTGGLIVSLPSTPDLIPPGKVASAETWGIGEKIPGSDILYNFGSNLYGVKIASKNADDQEVIDFAAHVRIWGKNIDDFYYSGTTVAIPGEYAKRVYIEVSWPVEASYDNREKRVYVREFYNVNN